MAAVVFYSDCRRPRHLLEAPENALASDQACRPISQLAVA